MIARAASNPPWAENDARLVLEDGSVWPGVACGARASAVGEAVFNTSLTGYQEILTDPSYKGQFVVFTVPHIGNVGINPGESEKVARALLGLNDEDLIGQCRRFFFLTARTGAGLSCIASRAGELSCSFHALSSLISHLD